MGWEARAALEISLPVDHLGIREIPDVILIFAHLYVDIFPLPFSGTREEKASAAVTASH